MERRKTKKPNEIIEEDIDLDEDEKEQERPFDFLTLLLVTCVTLVAIYGISRVMAYRKLPTLRDADGHLLFNKQELARFNSTSSIIYLAVGGHVFDVSAGPQYYGREGGYNGFSGRDGSRAYQSGQFDDAGLIESLEGFSAAEVKVVFGWRQSYHDMEKYHYMGKLIGHYYDSKGQETAEHKEYLVLLEKLEEEEARKKELENQFPPCNSRFANSIREVWCSKKSGGIERDWVGLPRLFTEPGTDKPRCACVHPKHKKNTTHFRLYEGCQMNADRCLLSG